ncbi:hypothetical protein AUK10_02470 [Candidatus Gracilibacteria bacterium CG2_30_37_12]|nr:MAG: hypothetical protein AUK10_02470 [Candidatus Gracilibacteria bacterium CG2_30_37_12]
MSQRPFFLGVLSTLGIIILIVIGLKFAGYIFERPLNISDFTIPVIHSGSTDIPSDCSTFPVGSMKRTNCEDTQANDVFTRYMNLPDTERLAFNCRKLLVREQQKLCVQEKLDIPKQQKQSEIMKQLANGGDIVLCDSFSSEKLEQDRCRLDFVLDRFPHSIPVTVSGNTSIQRKPELKDCAIVEQYGLQDRCKQEKERMKQIQDTPNKNSIR